MVVGQWERVTAEAILRKRWVLASYGVPSAQGPSSGKRSS